MTTHPAAHGESLLRLAHHTTDTKIVPVARVAVRAAVAPYGDVVDIEDVALVLTELLANAIQHGLPPVVVHLHSVDADIVVSVEDQEPASLPATNREATGEAGRGLQLVEAVAQEWGYSITGDTKVVWARFSKTVDD